MSSVQLNVGEEMVEIEVKEFNGNRVVTLKDIDILHKRPEGTARRTFTSQKKHFIIGEDYFVRNTSEAFNEYGLKAPNGLILLSESGYLLLVKTFTDELAWKVQKQLVKAYFKARELVEVKSVELVPQQQPESIEDILIMALSSMKEMKKENAELKKAVNHLTVVVDNEIHLTDQQCADIQEAVKKRVGQLMKQGYESHFQSIFSALKVHFSVPKYNKIRRADFAQALEFIIGWYPKKKENPSS